MKKALLIAALALTISTTTKAQTYADSILVPRSTGIERIEGELFGGIAMPMGDAEYGTKKLGWNAGAELRYNLRRLPIDLGVRFTHVTTNASLTTFQQNSIMATGDWNFILPAIPRLTPFAGAGVGVSWCDGHAGITAMPRVGVEYGDFVRLTFATQFSRQYYHNAQVTLGFVLGGRKDYAHLTDPTRQQAAQSVATDPTPLSPADREIYNLTMQRQRYQRRSTTYGILGGVSLGIGAFLATSGIVALAQNHNDDLVNTFYGVLFTGTGGLLTLGSIPLFIASHHRYMCAKMLTAKIDLLTTPTAANIGTTASGLGSTASGLGTTAFGLGTTTTPALSLALTF